MLSRASIKAEESAVNVPIRLLQGRAEDLSSIRDTSSAAASANTGIESGSVDKISMAFGIGYLSDQKLAFKEMRRVLRRPSGRVCILDSSLPAGEAHIAKFLRSILLILAP